MSKGNGTYHETLPVLRGAAGELAHHAAVLLDEHGSNLLDIDHLVERALRLFQLADQVQALYDADDEGEA